MEAGWKDGWRKEGRGGRREKGRVEEGRKGWKKGGRTGGGRKEGVEEIGDGAKEVTGGKISCWLKGACCLGGCVRRCL